MGVISVSIKNIGGEIRKPLIKKVKVEHVPQLKEVKKTKVVTKLGETTNKVDALDVRFEAAVNYKQNDEVVATLHMEGVVLYSVKDEKESEKLEERWKKEGDLEGKELEILNVVMKKSVPKFTLLAEMLSLPPVVQIPMFVKK